jgi:hypothetical protein
MLELLIVPCLLGLIPAVIAGRRGLSVLTWWLYGALLFPVAVIHVFFATPESVTIAGRAPARPCPHCAETIRPEAKVCKHCGRDVAPQLEPTRQAPRTRAGGPSWWDSDVSPGGLVVIVVVFLLLLGVVLVAVWRLA